jgi:diadenylate cyclase
MNQIIQLFQHINLKDFIDVFIVSIVIYNILVIIRGTRAVQILIGLLAIVILFWFSHSYQFYSLNWILDHFFDSFIVIFIIIFQEEIRMSLASLGKTKIWGKKHQLDSQKIVEEVIEACTHLASEKVGALIVFERHNGLANYAKTGTILDAKVHSDLIFSIFHNRSPLHDGAIIISDGRLFCVGAFLPLSKNIEIDRHYGTRHRAALGISEETDAVVILVSEESGECKLCVGGVFYQIEDESSLRRQLNTLLSRDHHNLNDGKEARSLVGSDLKNKISKGSD